MDRYTFVIEQLKQDDGHRFHSFDERGRGKFTTWLTVVLRRLCMDEHRHRYGRAQSTTGNIDNAVRRDLVDLVATRLDTIQIADNAALPDEIAARGELRGQLLQAVAQLQPEDRLVLRYRFEYELSVPEIAKLVGAPSPFHVYRRIDKLLLNLRQSFAQDGLRESVS